MSVAITIEYSASMILKQATKSILMELVDTFAETRLVFSFLIHEFKVVAFKKHGPSSKLSCILSVFYLVEVQQRLVTCY